MLIEGLPQVHCPTGQTFASLFNKGGADAVVDNCSPSHKWMKMQNDPQSAVFKTLSQRHANRVQIFHTISLFCKDDPCRLGNESGELLVWDELGHLTLPGQLRLESSLQRKIQEFHLNAESSRP